MSLDFDAGAGQSERADGWRVIPGSGVVKIAEAGHLIGAEPSEVYAKELLRWDSVLTERLRGTRRSNRRPPKPTLC